MPARRSARTARRHDCLQVSFSVCDVPHPRRPRLTTRNGPDVPGFDEVASCKQTSEGNGAEGKINRLAYNTELEMHVIRHVLYKYTFLVSGDGAVVPL